MFGENQMSTQKLQKKRQRKEQNELQRQPGGGDDILEKVRIDARCSNFLRPCPPKTNEKKKECEDYGKVDQVADDWRAQEIAKDIARHKVESMKKIAKKKAKEEKERLESELELILIVEKLKELRSIRIEKMKKQGHFFPEEDDKFLDRVRATVEEEELHAVSAASTDAAMDAIATTEGSRKSSNQPTNQSNYTGPTNTGDAQVEAASSRSGGSNLQREREMPVGGDKKVDGNLSINFPVEFYHYYHGNRYDMGTLIEVRRTRDAYLRLGGSRLRLFVLVGIDGSSVQIGYDWSYCLLVQPDTWSLGPAATFCK